MDVNKYRLPVLLFDEECVLCQRFKMAVEKISDEETLRLVPLQDENIYRLYPYLNPEECAAELHLIDSDQTIHKGEDAITKLLEILPAAKSFSWLLEKDRGKKAISYFYKMADRYRKTTLSKTCKDC